MCHIAEKYKKSHKNLAFDIKLCYNANGFVWYEGIDKIDMNNDTRVTRKGHFLNEMKIEK